MILRAKNWHEFQHYKDRAPIWIKLHKKLLDDRVFLRLPDASKALAPLLWLLASESKDGSITDYMDEISFRLHMTEKKVEEALNPLIQAGYFYVEQVDSTTLAEPEQVACLEKNREEKNREEEFASAFEAFSLAAQKYNWPKPTELTEPRRKKLGARLKQHGMDGWGRALAKAQASKFICQEMSGWSFDWLIEQSNFAKVLEGNYDDRRPSKVVLQV